MFLSLTIQGPNLSCVFFPEEIYGVTLDRGLNPEQSFEQFLLLSDITSHSVHSNPHLFQNLLAGAKVVVSLSEQRPMTHFVIRQLTVAEYWPEVLVAMTMSFIASR